ncbi:MAG: hypothetical protein WCD18_24205 [Thermosynechococcaceae cyanobacterium]
MTLQIYGLDREAQKLVLQARSLDADNSQNGSLCIQEAYKMRETIAYGLERFWGEHLRNRHKEPRKSAYWKATWDKLVEIMDKADIKLPNDSNIELTTQKLWGEIPVVEGNPKTKLSSNDQRIALAVLTQLCDCLVWWTQRYK